MMQRIIYALVDPRDGVVRYVGKSTKGLWPRVWTHRCDQTNTKRGAWIRKLRSLGMIFTPVILETEPDDIDEAERFWIAVYRQASGDKLTNMTDGGDGGSMSDEARAKVAASLRGRPKSAAHRLSIRLSRVGLKLSPQHKRKIGASLQGRSKTTEHRLNLSVSQRGRAFTPEHRARLSAAAQRRWNK